jgi:hypothetical protein
MRLEMHKAVQGAVNVHQEPQVPHVQGQSHGELQEGHEAHQIDQHEQEVVLNGLRNARSCSGCSPCTQ